MYNCYRIGTVYGRCNRIHGKLKAFLCLGARQWGSHETSLYVLESVPGSPVRRMALRSDWGPGFLRVHRVCYCCEPVPLDLNDPPLILCKFNAILSSAAISVMLGYLQPIIIRVFWPSAYVFLPKYLMRVS